MNCAVARVQTTYAAGRLRSAWREPAESVAELQAAITEYLCRHNAQPMPFIWTAKAAGILAMATRAKAAFSKSQNSRQTTFVRSKPNSRSVRACMAGCKVH